MKKTNQNNLLLKIKKISLDPILATAWFLAILSIFFVNPKKMSLQDIDFRTLGILWGLMVIIQGLKKNSLFDMIAERLLKKVTYGWQLCLTLILLPFFSAMLITNDVALIVFVPFSIMVLEKCQRKDLLIPVIVLQTIGANLGSMLTPIGNPQNLYLYGIAGLSLTAFFKITLPFTLASFVMLCLSILWIPNSKQKMKISRESKPKVAVNGGQILIFGFLFLTAILVVIRVLDDKTFLIIVLVSVLIIDKKLLLKGDYALLMTFTGFFIFVGNIGRMEDVSTLIEKMLYHREVFTALGISQIISNVPTALLLSKFTNQYCDLIIGVNLGGLGTLIASMASIISYKAYTNIENANRKKYLLTFTLLNIIFLLGQLGILYLSSYLFFPIPFTSA